MYKIKYSEPYLDNDDIKSANKVFKGKFLSNGPYVDKLEKLFCDKFKITNCLAVSNASNALILALKAHSITSKDIIWTASITFCSNVNSGLHLGAKIVLLDTDKDFPNLNLDYIEKKLAKTKKNKIPNYIILTYMGGFSIDLKKLAYLKKKYKFKVIEDASHSIGAKYHNNKFVGSSKLINATVFSTHAVKIITSGEGAILAINDKKIFNKAKLLRSHSIERNGLTKIAGSKNSKLYRILDLGFNYRITDFQCALLISQLNKLSSFKKKRVELCNYYIKNLSKKIFTVPECYKKEKNLSSLHLFVVLLNANYLTKRDKLIEYLTRKKIEVNIHYIPNHLHTFYKKNKSISFDKSDMKFSEDYFARCLTLPLHPGLKPNDIKKVIIEINRFFND